MHPIIDTHLTSRNPSRPAGRTLGHVQITAYSTVLCCRMISKRWLAHMGSLARWWSRQNSWLEDNQWILDLATKESAAQEPVIVGLVGHIDVRRAEFGAELARFDAHPLFCGIRCGGNALVQVDSGLFS